MRCILHLFYFISKYRCLTMVKFPKYFNGSERLFNLYFDFHHPDSEV